MFTRQFSRLMSPPLYGRLIRRWRNGRCRAVEATEGGEQTSWGSEGRCKRPSGIRGGAQSKKYVSKISRLTGTCLVYIYTSWIPGSARDPLSRSLSPPSLFPLSPLSYSSLPSTLPPSDYPASLRITAFPRYFLNLEA